MDLKKLLLKTKIKNGTASLKRCSEEDSKKYRKMFDDAETLPKEINVEYTDEGRIFWYYSDENDITEKDMNELLLNLQLKSINTIKKCVIFFTVLAVLSLIAGAITGIVMLSQF